MNITDAINIMESISGVTDESTPVGEAWNVILRYIHNPTPTPPAALSEQPVGPTDEEIMEMMPQQMRDDLAAAARALARFHQGSDLISRSVHRIILNRHAVDHARAVLSRWGQPYELPTTQHIPVSERLPQAEDCDAENQCWWFSRETESQWSKWTYFRGTGAESHWLPYHSLPLPIKPWRNCPND